MGDLIEGRSQPIERRESIAVCRLLEPDLCRKVVAGVQSIEEWEPAKVFETFDTLRVERVTRRSRVLYEPHARDIFRPVREKITESLIPHLEVLAKCKLRLSQLQLLHYEAGDYFARHRDTGRGSRYRRLSGVCYLTEGFEGGETSFPSLDFKVRPAIGETVLFPSLYLHAGEPVTCGEKYVLNFFLGDAATSPQIF